MIPTYTKYSLLNLKHSYIDEPLVDIALYSNNQILVEMKYDLAHLPGATNRAFVRQSVAERLMLAASFLPEGYRLKVWDAWRSLTTQQHLYKTTYDVIKANNQDVNEDEILKIASQYISIPNPETYLHGTGGAVDVTIVGPNGKELNMGTEFDDFSEKSHTDYYNDGCSIMLQNRSLLYDVMTRAGFTNYPVQ